MKEFPHIPLDLLQELDRAFANRTPSKKETWDDIRLRVGNREVVDFLWARYEEQSTRSLKMARPFSDMGP